MSAATGLRGLTAAHASTQTYSITDLGTLSGGFETDAYALNGTGQAAGQAVVKVTTASGYNYLWHAFLYSGGTMTDLNNLIPAGSGWVLTDATGINDAGQIICDAKNTTTNQTHAVLLSPR